MASDLLEPRFWIVLPIAREAYKRLLFTTCSPHGVLCWGLFGRSPMTVNSDFEAAWKYHSATNHFVRERS